MNKGNLITQLINTICDSSTPLWFPELTSELVNVGNEFIREDCDLSLSEYSTNRIWFKNKNANHSVFSIIQNPLPNNLNFNFIQIEILDSKIINKYKEAQVDFYEADEISITAIIDCVAEAIGIIKHLPNLLHTTFALTRSLHLIKPKDNDFDISFSEPHIPFSIFISVPNSRVRNDFLRVAEAIVHEAMHLQLTLIERVVPLVLSSNNKYYSPWKDEHRTIGGIMHAIYVFRVIDSFFGELLNFAILTESEKVYLIDRRNLISQQIISIQDFVNCPELTNLGKSFMSKLIKL